MFVFDKFQVRILNHRDVFNLRLKTENLMINVVTRPVIFMFEGAKGVTQIPNFFCPITIGGTIGYYRVWGFTNIQVK